MQKGFGIGIPRSRKNVPFLSVGGVKRFLVGVLYQQGDQTPIKTADTQLAIHQRRTPIRKFFNILLQNFAVIRPATRRKLSPIEAMYMNKL